MSISPATMRRIKRIAFRSRRRVRNAFAGAYQSIYKGRGLVFDSVRPYIPGDDIRTLDWKVSARLGEPYVRQYIEERELTLMLVVDGSASILFGSEDQTKRERGAEIGAILTYAAMFNNDQAGLLIFTDQIEHYVPPRKGRNHALRIIRDLLTFQPKSTGSHLGNALRSMNGLIPAGAIVFILSDFLFDAEHYERDLRITARRHDTAAIILTDPLEQSLPSVGMIHLRDAETNEIRLVDTTSTAWQDAFKAQQNRLQTRRDSIIAGSGVGQVRLTPDGDITAALSIYFQQQLRQRRR